MPDPVTTQYLGLPGYVFLWILALVCCALFGIRISQYGKVLRSARAETRWDQLPKRLGVFAANVLGQRRLFEEPAIGIAHFVIFWSFVFYATSFFWNLARGLLPFLPIPYADEVGWVSWTVQAMGVLGLAGLLVAAVRRYVFTPPRLERSGDATLILALITIVLISSLAGSAAARAQAPSLYLGMWWLHMITVLGFLAYLPYSKHLHLLASPFGVFFASLKAGHMPAPSEGASQLKEFTWRQLFGGLACAECGRCDRACPAFNSGYPLSPKQLMHEMKQLVRTAGLSGEKDGRPFVGTALKEDEIWSCMSCYACMERCPVLNEHLPVLVEARRHLVAQGKLDARVQETLVKLTRYGNSFGQSPRARAKWTQGLEFKIRDARKAPVEYLWFVGDYAAFDPRAQEVTRAAARVFQRAGLDFGILYEAESNSGNDVRRVGEEGLFEALMEKNLAALAQAKFEHIVTTDPHSYHALKNEYGGNGRRLLHHTELIERLVNTGKLAPARPSGLAVTYHDPCYLGRCNGVFDPPRRILRSLGALLKEMPRNRGNTYCCGAGGGRIWSEDAPGIRERPAENRIREAASLPGVATLVVSCPKDLVMFQDALKTTGLEGKIAVADVVQIVERQLAVR